MSLYLISPADARKLEEKVKKKGGRALSAITTNLVDIVWGNERPKPPHEPVKSLPIKFSGKESGEKIEDLRKELEKKKAAGLIICKRSSIPSVHVVTAMLTVTMISYA